MTRIRRRLRAVAGGMALMVLLGPGAGAQDVPAVADDTVCGTLTVKNPGKAPFRLLRYQPPVGASMRVTLTVVTTTTTFSPQLPETKITTTAASVWDLEVAEVDSFGVIRTDARLVDRTYETSADRPELESEAGDRLGGSAGIEGWWARDPFGRVTELGVIDDLATDVEARAVFLEGLQELVCHYPWFPDVAVGQGAEWEIVQWLRDQPMAGDLFKDTWVWLEADMPAMTLNGVRLEAPIKTYEATGFTGEPGPVVAPGQPDLELQLVAWRQEQSPSVTADLRGLYLKASGSRESRIAYEVTLDGSAQTMAVEGRGRIEIESTPR